MILEFQLKYKENGKDTPTPLYHLLPETAETHLAKQLSDIQSEVQLCSASLLSVSTLFISLMRNGFPYSDKVQEG